MADRLYERSAEIAAIDAAVARLDHGRGSSLLLEGRAGRGKSTLVEYAVQKGQESGARTWVVRARHLTSAAPFEVLRRLLGPAVEEAGGVEALEGAARFAIPLFTPGSDLSHGVDYGCQWLIAWLAERSPLVLAIDDAHWADGASLRVLLDVQADISAQPVTMLVASRPVENPEVQRLLAAMAAQPDCELLAPATLSHEGVAAVVADKLGHPAHDAFVDECLKVSHGNAFYLHELLRPYESGFRPDQQTFVRDGVMSLRRTVAWRLGELGPEATTLAQAAAVLGDGCSLHLAAELARLDESVAVLQASRLEVASILVHGDPVEFLHPLLRAAVEAALPEVVKGELHARAARLLWLSGEPPESIAQHLVNSPGSADAEVAAFLAKQGRAALETGSLALATQLLRRALDEPATPDERPRILVDLGRAEHAQGQLYDAHDHLEAAMASDDRAVVLTAAAELFDVLIDAGRYDELGRFHGRVLALDPRGDSTAEVRLQAQLLANVFMAVEPGLELPAELADINSHALPVERDIDRYLLVAAAIYERTMQHGTTERLVENLRRAVAGITAADDASITVWDVRTAIEAASFLADDEIVEAEAVLDRVAKAVAGLRSSAPVLQAELEHRRIMLAMAKGQFEDVLATISLVEEHAAPEEMSRFTAGHRFIRGWIALQRGQYEEAATFLAERSAEENLYPALGAMLAGKPERVVALLATQRFSSDVDGPITAIEVELEPHLVASHAHELLGDRDSALREAEREVFIRRRYGPRYRLAQALRRRASFEPARRAVGPLAEAVELAESTPRRAVTARVLASYGAALRRVDRIPEARDALYRAVDLAGEMGMERLRQRAHQELVLAGGRPRRTRTSGPQALTEAQRQVARLAATGCTNRQIAEELFVTIKTVETHLAAVYRKLGIASRDEVAERLGTSAWEPRAAASAALSP